MSVCIADEPRGTCPPGGHPDIQNSGCANISGAHDHCWLWPQEIGGLYVCVVGARLIDAYGELTHNDVVSHQLCCASGTSNNRQDVLSSREYAREAPGKTYIRAARVGSIYQPPVMKVAGMCSLLLRE